MSALVMAACLPDGDRLTMIMQRRASRRCRARNDMILGTEDVHEYDIS